MWSLRWNRAVPRERRLAIGRAFHRTAWADRRYVAQTILAIGVVVVVIIVFVLSLLWATAANSNGTVLGFSVALGPLAAPVVLLAMLLVGRRHVRRLFVPVMLEHACCPSCGYDLTGLTPEDDGCVVCPECGAAWRMTARQR